jgi:hypothetical protein
MKRWQYEMVTVYSGTDLLEVLNRHGEKGWELVYVKEFKSNDERLPIYAYFKRPYGSTDI